MTVTGIGQGHAKNAVSQRQVEGERLLVRCVQHSICDDLTDDEHRVAHALTLSPPLSVLWALGAVALPLVAAGLALPTCRIRSFTSTTGLLYLAMIALLPGQLVGQLLFFVAATA